MISTNNKDVPFISIYKPDNTKELHRIQAVISLHKYWKKCELVRCQHAYTKILLLKHHQSQLISKCVIFSQLISKIINKKLMSAFNQILVNRTKKRRVYLAMRILDRFQANSQIYNIRHVVNKLKINNYHTIIQ
jgi:hypothetical protein